MSNDLVVNSSSSNDDEYYSHWLRRIVKKPTPVLYNMIRELLMIGEIENHKDKEVLEEQICERCKTHPDDVNWIEGNNVSPFFLFVINGYGSDSIMLKARDAIIESDSFRVFDELHILHREEVFEYLNIEVHQWFIKKLIVLKPNDVIKVFKNHDLSLDAATVIVSYLYGKEEQIAVLNVIMKPSDNMKCPSYHLIGDWSLINPEVLYNKQICSDMIYCIESCTKACCALIILRNVKISFEPLPISNRYLLSLFVFKCLENKCICISDDLVKLSLEILDLGLDRFSEEELYYYSKALLQALFKVISITCHSTHPCHQVDDFCKDKWVSYLRKIVDRCPVEMLARQNVDGHTPYESLINSSSLCQDDKWYEEVSDIFQPR